VIDRGLLASALAVALVCWGLPRVARGPRPPLPVDPLLLSAIAGLLIGRLVAVAVEDPAALGAVRDVFVIRGGVAFWPGLAGGAATYAYLGRGSGTSPWLRLSAAAPAVVAGYGTYEAMCVARDGCFGPAVWFGLTPPGLLAPVLPVGWVIAVLALGWAVRHQRRIPHPTDLLSAVLFLAVVRSVASFHLPRVGSALSSPHVQSLAVLVGGLAVALGLRARDRHTTPSRTRTTAATTTDE
jgi:hypothetical protein